MAIIPLVGIFVPKRVQPYVWGFLTIVLLSVWGWVNLPEGSRTGWQPYQFEHERIAIENNGLPDEAANAADIYRSLLAEHDETIFYFNFTDSDAKEKTLFEAWNPQDYPRLDAWLSGFNKAIETFIEATKVEHCRFRVPANIDSMNMQMRRINQLKGWGRLLIRAANRDLYVQQHEAALEKLLAVAGLAQHLYQQQTLFDQAAAFHIELLAARSQETFIVDHCRDNQQLKQIEQVYLELDPQWANNWPDILLREKLLVKNLAALMYEQNENGRIRVAHNAMMALQKGMGYHPRRLFWNQEKMNRIAVIGLWLTLPSSPQRLSRLIDKRFDHYSLLVQKGRQLPRFSLRYLWKYLWIRGINIRSIIDWLVTQKVGYFWALNGQFHRHEAVVNQIQIFCALKRYAAEQGHWPQKLEQLELDPFVLTDPLCGKPFVYEQTENSFRLYSLGPNGIDDNGINDQEGKDDIYLWPRGQVKEGLEPALSPQI